MEMNERPIPFNRVSTRASEIRYITEAIASGQIAGDQRFSKLCQSLLESTLGVQRTLVTTSCTHALEIAAILLDICPGDEVIIPSFTFVSTANAFVLRGAKPIFCDIRPDTLNLDETKIEGLVTERTRAIVPVHYAGVACEMDTILEIANRRGISVIEDNAHGLFGKYKGRWLGTLGGLATQSFHATKNISCGEGGALIINDEEFIRRAEIIREKGTDRARFFRGEVDKYSWVDIGSSYVMGDVLAAILFSQLESCLEIQSKRRAIWERYDAELRGWCSEQGVRQPIVPVDCEQAYHMYYLLMPNLASRTSLIGHLAKHNISAVFHYLPLHASEYIKRSGDDPAHYPVTEEVSDRIVRLPFFTDLAADEQDVVIHTVRNFSSSIL